jgi:lipoprotein-releasing system permease protein
MDVSLFIASRLRFKGRLAMICIAVSFLVMIIAVAVSSGFRNEIRDGISGFSGDIMITPVNMNYIGETSPIGRYPSWLDSVSSLEGVKELHPTVYRAGIVKNADNIHGVIFKGVESFGEDTLGSMTVMLPSRLAAMLSLEPGDDMPAYFIGERVRARKFKVASIYEPVADMEDVMVVYAALADMQRLNGWAEDEVSSMEILLKDRYRNVREMQAISDKVGFTIFSSASEDDDTVVASSAVESYPQLFDWLDLIDSNVLFIMVLMTVVAGFNMISGLLIMLFENISTIGLLKALGMTDMSIAKIFLASSSVIVLKGMAAGNLLAFAFCAVQGLTHFLALDPANYFVSFVPVHIDIGLVLLADLAAFCVIMLLLLIPSLFIAKVDPAKSVTVR